MPCSASTNSMLVLPDRRRARDAENPAGRCCTITNAAGRLAEILENTASRAGGPPVDAATPTQTRGGPVRVPEERDGRCPIPCSAGWFPIRDRATAATC